MKWQKINKSIRNRFSNMWVALIFNVYNTTLCSEKCFPDIGFDLVLLSFFSFPFMNYHEDCGVIVILKLFKSKYTTQEPTKSLMIFH